MRRDTIFYQLFLRFPQLLFELLPTAPADADQYTFEAIEVKETSFRTDGVWMPPTSEGTAYFAEAQFQPDEVFYERMNAEISIFTYRKRDRCSTWQGIVFFPSRDLQQSSLTMVSHLLDSGKILPIYLDELPSNISPALSMMVLTTLEGEAAITAARQALVQGQGNSDIMEMVATIMVYKFTQLTREEVDIMLGVTLQETRVYQDALAEGEIIGEARGEMIGEARGEVKGKLEMVVLILNQRLRGLPESTINQLSQLSVEQIEALGIALFDFQCLTDLTAWLGDIR
jgi:predicted transposase/invertase (TIGR01784 family)